MKNILALVLLSLTANAQYVKYYGPRKTQAFTYFVDPAGSDFNTGTTAATPFATIAKVNSLTLTPGQSVGFKRGGIWRESLVPPSSGTSSSLITFGAYGTGSKPVINGADVITGWTVVSGTTYSKVLATEPRVVLWNGVRLAQNAQLPTAQNVSIFNETFEGAGYTTTWTNSGSPNADALSSAAGSPASWGSQSLLVDPANSATKYARKDFVTDRAITYVRFEFVLSADSLTEYNEYADIFQELTSGFGVVWKVGIQRTALGPIKLLLTSTHNGSSNFYNSLGSIYPGRKYRVEVKWDATGTTWAWRVNGIAQPNNVDSTTPITSEGTLTSTFPTSARYLYAGTIAASNKGYSIYYDNVAADATTWVGSPAGALDASSWTYQSGTLYVNVGADPATGMLEAGQRDNPVTLTKNYIKIKDLSINNANHSALYINNSNHITLDGTDLVEGGLQGTHFGSAGGSNNDFFTFRNGSVHGFGSSGINVDVAPGINGSANNVYIGYSSIYDNGWKYAADTAFLLGNTAGIKLWGGYHLGATPAPNATATVENNAIYQNLDQWGDGGGYGLWADQWGTGAIVRRNTFYNNDAGGVFVENMDGSVVHNNTISGGINGISVYRNANSNLIYHNDIYGASRWGLGVFGGTGSQQTMTGNVFKNNISHGNGVNLSAVWGGETSSVVYTYNCLGPESSRFIQWGLGTYKATYAAFATSYGSATNSVSGDPLFTNAGTRDFTLQSGSPCIDTGTVISGINDGYLGAAPDIGAFEKQ